LSDKNLRVRR